MDMNYLSLFEFFGSISAIAGALMMSRSTHDNTRPLYYSFILYFIGNIFMIYFFLFKGLVPLLVQMLFFMVTSINGIVRLTLHRRRDITLLVVANSVYSVFLAASFIYTPMETVSYSIGTIELIASMLAIGGSFILASKKHTVRLNAFISFMVADLLLIYVSIVNDMYFFLAQSAFFVYTSTAAYIRTYKSAKLEAVILQTNKTENV